MQLHLVGVGRGFEDLDALHRSDFDLLARSLVDSIAERVQLLGGVTLAMAHDVAETTLIPRPPRGREGAPVQISRLLHAHEIVLKEARSMARLAAAHGDEGTNDLLVSEVVRRNELQVWFISQHAVPVPLVADDLAR